MTERNPMQPPERGWFEIGGWLVFVFSAICYIASGWRAGDLLSTVGGVLFLGACFLFLVPMLLYRERKAET